MALEGRDEPIALEHKRPKLSLWEVITCFNLCADADVQHVKRGIITAVIYYYITTETWLSPFSVWRCYVWRKTLIDILAEIW